MTTAAALARLLRGGGALRRINSCRRTPLSVSPSARPQKVGSFSYGAPSSIPALPFTSTAHSHVDDHDDVGTLASEEPKPQQPEMKKGDWICPTCNFMNFARNLRCLKCKIDGPNRLSFDNGETREGDWTCPGCNFMNFARNGRCLRCLGNRPGHEPSKIEVKKGDWNCARCNTHNFARYGTCRQCGGDRGVSFGFRNRLDWNCPSCRYLNYSRNSTCLRCQEPRPHVELKMGDWECPSCKFLNFSNNTSCFKCSHTRPEDDISAKQDDLLRQIAEGEQEASKFGNFDPKEDDIDSVIEDLNKIEDKKT